MPIETLAMESEISPTEWTAVGSGASTVLAAVAGVDGDDETPASINAAYASDAGTGALNHKFTVANYGVITALDTINSVSARGVIRGTNSMRFVIWLGASATYSGYFADTSGAWVEESEVLARPGGGAWSLSDLNSLEASLLHNGYFGALYNEVDYFCLDVDYTLYVPPPPPPPSGSPFYFRRYVLNRRG